MQLIDEYDSIMESVTPFFSLTPREIIERVNVLGNPPQGEGNHAILEFRDGEQLPWKGATWRPAIPQTWDIMLGGIAEYLPDMKVAVFLHDGPMVNMDAGAKQAYIEAGKAGERQSPSLVPPSVALVMVTDKTAYACSYRRVNPAHFRMGSVRAYTRLFATCVPLSLTS